MNVVAAPHRMANPLGLVLAAVLVLARTMGMDATGSGR